MKLASVKPLKLFVIGPSASGKSQFSLEVGQSFKIPIVNCDSLQVYKHVDIGTAKPTLKERQKVAHHLFDFVEPPTTLTAADYIEEVKTLYQSQDIGNAIFVGGSGFYIQALEKGLYPGSEVSQEVVKEVETWINEKGFEDLYTWIEEKDPEFAKKISVNDHYRVRRAVEIMKTQSKTMTELKSEMLKKNLSVLPSHEKLKIGFYGEKSIMRKRVELRTQEMLKMGLIDEVKKLIDQGFRDWPPLKSVGYKEVLLHLDGEILLKELPDRITTSTMQLIKKQMTWFKRDQEIQWFDLADRKKAFDRVTQFVQTHKKA